jgi:hypothetical protein
MVSKLKDNHQVWKLALDLGLKPKDDAVGEILRFCARRVRSFADQFKCKTLTELLEATAASVGTIFEEINNDSDLERVRLRYLKMGEMGFATLEKELDSQVYAITFQRLHAKPWERPYVSVIDCRGDKRWRRYYSKWHEVAHLLTLTAQLRLAFRRTHSAEGHKNAEEALMDVIAGRFGFFADIVAEHASGEISFQKIEELRVQLCPEASKQAVLIGFVRAWPTPCVLIQAELALRKREKESIAQNSFGFYGAAKPALRAIHVTANDSARDIGMTIFENMRVPERSIIHQVFSRGTRYLEAVEDLSWWEASDGTRLRELAIAVKAETAWSCVQALIIPLD